MYYLFQDKLYALGENGEVSLVNVSAKDTFEVVKRLVDREYVCEFVDADCEKVPSEACPVTLDEVACKYAISQEQPFVSKAKRGRPKQNQE